MQSTLQEPTEASTWNQLSPLLDEAMSRLGKKDRDAVLLRFFKEKNVREVAATLQVNEAAAQRRILRALEKLRKFFTKRGVSSTTAIIAGAISANSVQAAPTALAKSVTTVAIAKGAAASGSTLTLIKGALKIMAWTKAKTAAAVGVGIILAAGTTTITIKEIEAHKTYDWQVPEVNVMILNTAQPQVRIVTTKFPKFGGSMSDGNRFIGIAATITNLITCAYSNSTQARTIFPAELPQGRYDFIANFPVGSAEALNQEIKKKFGVVGRFEARDAEVWLLKIKRANAPGLKSTLGQGRNNWMGVGHYEGQNQPMTSVASVLEGYFGIPVIDETGMNGRFDIELLWDEQSPRQNPDGLKEALLDELGLELVPSREPIEMLIVEKAP